MSDQPEQLQKPRPRRWRKVLVILVGLVVLLALSGWIYNYVGRTRLDDAIRTARAQGLPVTFADIENEMKQWPENQNGAKIVLDMAERLGEINRQGSELDLPILGAFLNPSLGTKWTDAVQNKVDVELARWADDIAQIDKVLNYERGWLTADLTPFPFGPVYAGDYATLRTAVRLKALQIEVNANRGKTDELASDVDVMLRLGRFVNQPPFVIGSLIEAALNALTFFQVETVCALAHPSDDQLVALDHLLAEIDLLVSFQASLVGERAYTIGTAQPFTRLIPRELRFEPITCTTDGCSHSHTLTWIPGIAGWHIRNHTQTLDALTRALAVEADPQNPHRFYTELRRQLEPRDSSYHLSNNLLASLSRALKITNRSVAEVTCARVALAAERYRLATGDFPETLDQLAPDYLEELPHDPFNGQPLRYTVSADHVIIYSVGEDLTDDGGDVERRLHDRRERPKDFGFVLLPVEKRGQPPATQTAPASNGEDLSL